MTAQQPTAEELLQQMRAGMGTVPSAVEKSVRADPGLIYEHMRSRGYAMPATGAFDEEVRTLIYLAAALAGSSPACVRAMADRIRVLKIAPEKVREVLHIVRFAMATKIIGDAEPVFDALNESAVVSR